MQRGRGKFHSHVVGNIIKRHQILAVHILHRHAESHVGMLHLHKRFQRPIPSVKAVRDAADFVVRLLQPFNADADAHFWKFPAQGDDTIRKVTVGRYDNSVRFFIKLPHDIGYILSDKRLSARDIGERHLRQLFDVLQRDLFLRPGRVAEAVAHVAAGVTAVCHNHGSV